MRVIRCLLVILAASMLLHAQPAADSCSLRSIPLGVLDREYHFIENLKPPDVRIKARDQGLAIRQMSLTSPRRLILLLDVSGSMIQKNKWEVIRFLAYDVIAAAPDDLEIALSAFASQYHEIVGYTRDRNALRGALAALTYDGLKARKGGLRTLLGDALIVAARQNSSPSFGDVIYVLTDGEDARSNASLREIRQEVTLRSLRVFFFLVRENHKDFSDLNSSSWQELATASGGHVIDLASSWPSPSLAYSSQEFFYKLDPKNLRDLSLAARILYTSMFRFYSLEVQIPGELQGLKSKLKVAVVDQHGEKMKKVGLIYPQELPRCSTLSQVR